MAASFLEKTLKKLTTFRQKIMPCVPEKWGYYTPHSKKWAVRVPPYVPSHSTPMGRFDSKIRFDSNRNAGFDSRFDSDANGPSFPSTLRAIQIYLLIIIIIKEIYIAPFRHALTYLLTYLTVNAQQTHQEGDGQYIAESNRRKHLGSGLL